MKSCPRSCRLLLRRALTTSATTPKPLTLVHKTATLLPKAIPQSDVLATWKDVLAARYEDLAHTQRDSVRIAIYGVDKQARLDARVLLATLLQDPFGPEDTASIILSQPYGSFVVGHADLQTDHPSIRVSSAYLQQLPVNAHFHVIEEGQPESVYKYDAAIIVCNPLTSPLLQQTPKSSIPVYIAPPSMSAGDAVCIDPSRALDALQQLRAAPTTTSFVVQRYQDNFSGSGIPALSNALRDALKSSPDALALSSLNIALDACEHSLKAALREVDQAFIDSSALEERVEEAKVVASGEVLGTKTEEGDVVTTAMKRAEKSMRETLNRLTLWRMIARVDELSGLVGGVVERVWCKDLEKQLILQTGRLSALQQKFAADAEQLVSSRPPSLRSALLSNTLKQLESSPQFSLTPRSLTHPIHTRMDQLITYPTTRLHLAGQRTVLGIGASTSLGLGVSWASWIGYVPEHTWGLGALTALLGLRWAMGAWERAKRRWWEDWKRVGEGLSRDLKAELDRVMNEQVTSVAVRAYNGLVSLGKQRKEELLDVRDQVQALKRDIKRAESGGLN